MSPQREPSGQESLRSVPTNAQETPALEKAALEKAALEKAAREKAAAEKAAPEIATQAVQGQWLHPISLVFEFAAGIRGQLVPAVLAVFSATTGSWLGGLIALLFFVGSMALVVLRYIRLRYRLTDQALIVDEGMVFRVHRTVPIERIQNIDSVQNPFHRLLGVAEVRVETASGTKPEAVLRVLSLADVESLRNRIFARKQTYASSGEPAGSAAPVPKFGEPPPVEPAVIGERSAAAVEAGRPELLIRISLRQLALAGIASNRGTALLVLGLGLISQQASSISPTWHINTEDFARYLPEKAGAIAWLLLALIGLVSVLVLLKILSIAWYVLKFYDYTLERSGDDLRVSSGLLTRVSATVRRDRIQLISIHRTLIGRWLKIASIRLETAGGGKDSDDPASTIARRWFMPVISETQVPVIMEQLSPGRKWNEEDFAWQPLSRRATSRRRRLIVLLAGGLAVLAGLVGSAVAIVALVLVAALGWWWSSKSVAATRYARSPGKLLFQSGVLTRKCSLAFVDKIQSVTVDHSPFDRRWNMATLSVDTMSSGPAEHRLRVSMLDSAVARTERDLLCQAASDA